jgi:hypothetical protein
MKKSGTAILLVSTVFWLTSSLQGHAQWNSNLFNVLDIHFDSDSYGTDPATTTPPPYPATKPQAVNSPSSTDFANTNGFTQTVGDAAGLTKAVVFSNNVSGAGVTWIDTDFNPTLGGFLAERGVFTFDFAQMVQPADTLPQDGRALAINGFTDSSDRAFTFIVHPTSPTGGTIRLRNPGDGSANTDIGTYTLGVSRHVEINVDNVHRTVNVALDGVTAITGFPFPVDGIFSPGNGTNEQLKEFFIFQNGVDGQLNVSAIDNITYVTVPEASPAMLIGIGVLSFIVIFRRPRQKS